MPSALAHRRRLPSVDSARPCISALPRLALASPVSLFFMPSSVVVVVVAAVLLVAHAQSPPVLDVVHVPLTFSQDNQRYLANVNMSTGNTQRFSFALSTTTGNSLVANSSCTSCSSDNIPTYNATQSTSAVQIQDGTHQQSISIAGNATNAGSGTLSQEDCALAQANGSFWLYPKQPIVQVASSSVFQQGISGLVGLGTNDFNNTIFNGWFARNPLQHDFTFGLALNPPPNSSQSTLPSADPQDAPASAGTLHMMQSDPLAHSGPISWYDAQKSSDSDSANASVPWSLQLDGWNFSSGASQTSNSAGGPAALEPYFATIFLPRAQAAQLYAAVPGASPLPAQDQQPAAFAVPCDAILNFSVIVAAQPYPVPPDALLLRAPDGSCLGAIEGWADPARTDYLLGSRFISAYYVTFQVGRPPDATQKIGLAPRALAASPPRGPNTGAIVGGVIGGVALVLLLFALLFWYIHKRTRTTTRTPNPLVLEKPATSPCVTLGSFRSSTTAHAAAPALAPLPPLSPDPRTTPDPFYPPPSSAGSAYPPISPPPRHENFPLLPSSSASPRVSQWVRGMRPTSASYDVPPAHYDYGNRGEPGAVYDPRWEAEDERGR